MRKNVMRKNLQQTILKSITRYIAIVLIIALGAAIFVGLRTTKSDMIETGQRFMDESNMFDLRLLNTYGWSKENVDQVAQLPGVVDAEGVITMDALGNIQNVESEGVYKLYAIPQTVTKVHLLGGRMPEKPNECLVDGAHTTDAILGKTFVISQRNDDETLESLKYHAFTVVGYISTPMFMDMSRGTTTLGNGTVRSYLYLPEGAFDVDYYSEIGITIDGDYRVYSDEFDDAMDQMAENIEPLLIPIAQLRYEQVRQDALEAYEEGLQEYHDGLREFQDGKTQAMQELEDARQQLLDGQAEIDAARKLLEDGKKQLQDGKEAIQSNTVSISKARRTLMEEKAKAYKEISDASNELLANYKTVSENLTKVDSALLQINSGLEQINTAIPQLEAALAVIDSSVAMMDTMLEVMDVGIKLAEAELEKAKLEGTVDPEIIAGLEEELSALRKEKESYEQQKTELAASKDDLNKQLQELYTTKEQLDSQKSELQTAKNELDTALVQIEDGFLQLQTSQAQAEKEFAAAEYQLESGQVQLDKASLELQIKQQELEDGLKDLEKAEAELADGWKEYRKGREEALSELADAELELLEGQVELKKAKKIIDEFTDPDVYALTRNTNASYISLESNASIVEGVSAVFPAFFLLIAALVCITTMTRMIEEERTQIGTLKALGYSNWAIISKYIFYAGSAAILGCGFGVLIGSVVFPIILWNAYNIILNITPNIVLLVDWPLCLLVVFAYTAVTLLVTWYCCRMSLREVPAELIRPKPPTSGKKIFLEYLPFWQKFSFLNKVMLRNIFRYKQRLLMMLVGIGGCTALLVTGFGIRDSIVDIVNYQFREVTLYDMEVRFAEGMSEDDQQSFREQIGRYVDKIGFVHQSSVELHFGGQSRDIVLIASDREMEQFMDFHRGETALSMPQSGGALLSVGAAEKMGISVGDSISVKDSDMKNLDLTVTGIYDNHVSNFVIICPETIVEQWGKVPEKQMAYISVKDTQDVHYAGTRVQNYDGVMNVTINEDLADQIGSMLDAMDLVVVTIVISAGLLAVTVLYNLTNINITERIREIATIKVLGFRSTESAMYVFKENLLLSAAGAFFGLFGGYALLTFVMTQIKVDMVWFTARVTPMSFVWSVVITMLMACLVDFILYFKLDKINMAEALKSIE